MKKFKLFKIFSIFAIAAAGAVAVGAGTKAPKVEAAEAAATSSRLLVKFGSKGSWSDANAKLAVYLWKGSGSSKVETWTNLASLSDSSNLYVLDYTFDGTPENMIISRQNSSATSASWSTSWNQSADLTFNEATYINLNGWDITGTSGWKLSADVRSSVISSFGTKTTLSASSLELVSRDHGSDIGTIDPQVSGYVTLAENEEFKMLAGDGTWSAYYGTPSALAGYFSGGSKTGVDPSDPNIVCNLAGTYEFFFNTETKRVWITRQDVVDADGWATYFNSNVGCDPDGVSLPSGWSNCATAYGNLSDDAKDYIYGSTADEGGDNLARALATYDYAVAHHSTLTKFIKNSSNVVRTSINLDRFEANIFFGNDDNGLMISIVVISIVSVSALAGLLFIRKRKHI